LISASLGGGEIKHKLEFLQPELTEQHDFDASNYSEADLNTFRAFGMKPQRKE